MQGSVFLTQVQYNLGMIAFFSITIISVIVLAIILFKEGQKLGWFKKKLHVYKTVVTAVTLILCLGLAIYLISGISYGVEESSKVEIVDIIKNGSYAGTMDSYSLQIKFDNGTQMWVSTPLFASDNLNKKAENLKIGDVVTIKYVNNIQSVYCIEE